MPNDNNQDPWKGSGKKEGPPDLDELLRNLQNKINAFFNKKAKPQQNAGRESTNSNSPKHIYNRNILLGLSLFLVIWILSGIFIVSPAEQAVIVRFGKYVKTMGPGPHWIPRFFESYYILNVQQISEFPFQAEMLTQDENIVSVEITVQYRIDDPKNYLFNVVDPNASLRQATASALRQIVGNTTLDDILTSGRQKVAQEVSEQIKKILSIYNPGIQITDITLQSAKPPEAVTDAFDDAIKAREDEQRYINQAYAYMEKVQPIAHGQASRLLEAANAYKQQVVLDAQAATAKYLALLPEYQKNPQLMRQRLYIDAIESVLTKSNKVMIDTKGGQNLIYLPLDKIMSFPDKKLPLEEADTADTSTTQNNSSDTTSTTSMSPLSSGSSSKTSQSTNIYNYPTRGAY